MDDSVQNILKYELACFYSLYILTFSFHRKDAWQVLKNIWSKANNSDQKPEIPNTFSREHVIPQIWALTISSVSWEDRSEIECVEEV